MLINKLLSKLKIPEAKLKRKKNKFLILTKLM